MKDVQLIKWGRGTAPSEHELREILEAEGLQAYRWGNAPGEVYSAHAHSYHKVIYVVRGSIIFILPDHDSRIEMNPGDRLELPAGIVHRATVGSQGVVCLEAHRS